MTPAVALTAALVLLSILLVPGYVLLRGLGVLRLQALAGAPAIAALEMGGLAIVYHWTGLAWTRTTVLAGLALLTLAALPLRRLTMRGRQTGPQPRPWPPLLIALGLAALVSGTAWMVGARDIDAAMQASDGVWHLNAAAYVRTLLDAYPVGALAPMYWGEIHYYPVSWHSLVAILPATVPTSANLVALVGLALVWPLGCASLLAALFPVGRRTVLDGLPVLAGTLAATAATAPFVMMTTLWPYGWSVCLLPGVLALIVTARRVPALYLRRGSQSPRGGALAAALAAMGLVYVHGAAAFNLAVLGAPVLLVASLEALRGWWNRTPHSRLMVLAAGAVVILLVVVGARVFWDQLSMLLSYSRSRALVSTVFVEALRDDVMIYRIPDAGVGSALLTIMAMAGVVVSVRREIHRWAVLAAALAMFLLVASVWSASPLHILATPWYVQKSRILPLLEIPVLVLAATALREAIIQLRAQRERTGASGDRRWRRPVAGALAVVAGVVPVATAAVRAPLHERVVAYAYQPEVSVWPVMLAPGEREFLESSAELLPEGAIILSEPTNGSAYYWSLTGTEVVFPSLRRNSERDRLYVSEHATEIRTDPEVCAALGRLGAHYLYLDADRSEGRVPAGGERARWRNSLKNFPIGALRLVATDGTHSLWLITACGWEE